NELRDLRYKHQPVCVCVQESLLASANSFNLSNYSILRKDIDNPDLEETGRGVCLLTKSTVSSSPVQLNTSLEAVAVRVFLNRLITVCSIYISPNQILSAQDFEDLINQLPRPFLVLGDFNAHHPLWGSPDINPRGRLMEKLIYDNDLAVLNDGN